VDGIEADHLAGQAEAQYLLVALAVVDEGLDHARAHRGDRIEGIAGAEDVVACVVRTDVVHQHVQVRQAGLVHPFGHAGIGERAGAAEAQRVAIVGCGRVRREPGIALWLGKGWTWIRLGLRADGDDTPRSRRVRVVTEAGMRRDMSARPSKLRGAARAFSAWPSPVPR
jgi:hypothetical protein